MLNAIPEGQEKKPRSNALMIAIAIIGFLLGMEFATIVISINFINAEIDDLRSDTSREVIQIERALEELNKDVDDIRNGNS